MLCFLLSCSSGEDLLNNSTPAGLKSPHPVGFELKESHGLYLLKANLIKKNDMVQACGDSQCHGSELKGGAAKSTCYECHVDYPHEDNIGDQPFHGVSAYSSAEAVKCQDACHKPAASNSNLEKNCERCHTLFGHPSVYSEQAGYAYWKEHGGVTLESDAEGCMSRCHGKNLRGGTTKQDCYGECHRTLHMGEKNYKGTRHMVESRNNPTDCLVCHSTSDEKIIAGPATGKKFAVASCFSCHVAYPHPFANSDDHITLVTDAPQGDQTCQTATACHTSDLKGEAYNYPLACTAYCHIGTRPGPSIIIKR